MLAQRPDWNATREKSRPDVNPLLATIVDAARM